MNTLNEIYFNTKTNKQLKEFIRDNKELLTDKQHFKTLIYDSLRDLTIDVFTINTDKQNKIFNFVHSLFLELKKISVFDNYVQYQLVKNENENYNDIMFKHINWIFFSIDDGFNILTNQHKKESLKILDSYIGKNLRKSTEPTVEELKEMNDKIDNLIMEDDNNEEY